MNRKQKLKLQNSIHDINLIKHLSCAGIILEEAISDFQTIALYQPAVNGLAGNLVGIYSSTLSTTLHRTGSLGSWAIWAPEKFYLYPIEAFVGARSMRFKIKFKLPNLINLCLKQIQI